LTTISCLAYHAVDVLQFVGHAPPNQPTVIHAILDFFSMASHVQCAPLHAQHALPPEQHLASPVRQDSTSQDQLALHALQIARNAPLDLLAQNAFMDTT